MGPGKIRKKGKPAGAASADTEEDPDMQPGTGSGMTAEKWSEEHVNFEGVRPHRQ
jgi:hypothetical protein